MGLGGKFDKDFCKACECLWPKVMLRTLPHIGTQFFCRYSARDVAIACGKPPWYVCVRAYGVGSPEKDRWDVNVNHIAVKKSGRMGWVFQETTWWILCVVMHFHANAGIFVLNFFPTGCLWFACKQCYNRAPDLCKWKQWPPRPACRLWEGKWCPPACVAL